MSDYNFELGEINSSASGLDAFFEDNVSMVTPLPVQSGLLQPPPKVASKGVPRRKVASLSDLNGFTRIATDQLVNKSNQELWALRQSGDGGYYIERMFESNQPLKGG